jgi:hypothetical protein
VSEYDINIKAFQDRVDQDGLSSLDSPETQKEYNKHLDTLNALNGKMGRVIEIEPNTEGGF